MSVTRLVNASKSDFEKMSPMDLKSSVFASEGRTIMGQHLLFAHSGLVRGVTNSEVMFAFGADMVMLNTMDLDNLDHNPGLQNLTFQQLKERCGGRPIGVYLGCPTMLKMVRGEGGRTSRLFFRKVRESFIPSFPATILLFVDVTLLAILYYALYAETLVFSPFIFVLLAIVTAFLTALLSYLFPLLARFDNTFPQHLENAVRLALANLPVTVLMTLVNLLPLLSIILFPDALLYLVAFWPLMGVAALVNLDCFYLNRIFNR